MDYGHLLGTRDSGHAQCVLAVIARQYSQQIATWQRSARRGYVVLIPGPVVLLECILYTVVLTTFQYLLLVVQLALRLTVRHFMRFAAFMLGLTAQYCHMFLAAPCPNPSAVEVPRGSGCVLG